MQRRGCIYTVQLKTVLGLLSDLGFIYEVSEAVHGGAIYCRLGQVIPYSDGIWEVRVLVDLRPGVWY